MKLYRNKYIQIIYFLLVIPILIFLPFQYLKIIDEYIYEPAFLIILFLFFLFTFVITILTKNSPITERIIIFGGIMIIPILLLGLLLFTYSSAWQAAVFGIVILFNIQGGILFKWNYAVFIFSIFYIALSFKIFRIPGADILLLTIAPLVFINAIVEIFRVRKHNKYKSEYLKLFYIQALSYLILTISIWFVFLHIGELLIGKILVYLSYVLNLVFLLLLPKSEFLKWDTNLKKRFRSNNIYAGIAFFILALVFALSDIVGYDIVNLIKDSYFIDYPINFNLPTI